MQTGTIAATLNSKSLSTTKTRHTVGRNFDLFHDLNRQRRVLPHLQNMELYRGMKPSRDVSQICMAEQVASFRYFTR